MGNILDTNIWVAYFDADDSLHAKASKYFVDGATYVVPDFIIVEVASVLRKKGRVAGVRDFLEFVQENADVTLLHSQEYFKEYVTAFLKTEKTQLSFPDASLYFLSTKFVIHTFDKELLKEITRGKRKQR
jgi:predicted nucleic acid-binding protein